MPFISFIIFSHSNPLCFSMNKMIYFLILFAGVEADEYLFVSPFSEWITVGQYCSALHWSNPYKCGQMECLIKSLWIAIVSFGMYAIILSKWLSITFLRWGIMILTVVNKRIVLVCINKERLLLLKTYNFWIQDFKCKIIWFVDWMRLVDSKLKYLNLIKEN